MGVTWGRAPSKIFIGLFGLLFLMPAAAEELPYAPQPPPVSAYINPQTGKFDTPPPGSLQQHYRRSLHDSVDSLEVKAGPGPAYGVMIDLQGRLQHGFAIEAAPDGTLNTRCTSQAPQAPADGAPQAAEPHE